MKNNIASLRAKAGLTQQQLADQLKLPRRTISRWENGTNPRNQQLHPLAEQLGCRVTDILEPETTLSELRQAVGLSQQQIAELLDQPKGSISAFETGRTKIGNPSQWAQALGRTTIEIRRLSAKAIRNRYKRTLNQPDDA